MAAQQKRISGTFTGTGASTDHLVIKETGKGTSKVDIFLSDFGVGTIALQIRRSGGTFKTIQTWTAGTHLVKEFAGSWEAQLLCSAYTSGTIAYDMSE